MSIIVTFRVWGDLEKWYQSLPEREKATHIREAIRRGISNQSQPNNYQMELSNVKVNQVEKEESLEDLDGKLDNLNFWGDD